MANDDKDKKKKKKKQGPRQVLPPELPVLRPDVTRVSLDPMIRASDRETLRDVARTIAEGRPARPRDVFDAFRERSIMPADVTGARPPEIERPASPALAGESAESNLALMDPAQRLLHAGDDTGPGLGRLALQAGTGLASRAGEALARSAGALHGGVERIADAIIGNVPGAAKVGGAVESAGEFLREKALRDTQRRLAEAQTSGVPLLSGIAGQTAERLSGIPGSLSDEELTSYYREALGTERPRYSLGEALLYDLAATAALGGVAPRVFGHLPTLGERAAQNAIYEALLGHYGEGDERNLAERALFGLAATPVFEGSLKAAGTLARPLLDIGSEGLRALRESNLAQAAEQAGRLGIEALERGAGSVAAANTRRSLEDALLVAEARGNTSATEAIRRELQRLPEPGRVARGSVELLRGVDRLKPASTLAAGIALGTTAGLAYRAIRGEKEPEAEKFSLGGPGSWLVGIPLLYAMFRGRASLQDIPSAEFPAVLRLLREASRSPDVDPARWQPLIEEAEERAAREGIKLPDETDPVQWRNERHRARLALGARFPDGNDDLARLADEYLASNARLISGSDQAPAPVPRVNDIDEDFARKVADWYDAAPSNPADPEVRASYNEFVEHLEQQYRALVDAGYRMIPSETDPYPNSFAMMRDVLENKTLRVFAGDLDHPLLTPEQQLKFRWVHDLLGHALEGNPFNPVGEENAFRAHSRMFPAAARRALATETRAQSSWVNFGPQLRRPDGTIPKRGDSDYVSPHQRPAIRKAVLMPEEFTVPYAASLADIPVHAKQVFRLTEANGGATWNPVLGDLGGRPFYAVAISEPGRYKLIDGRATEDDIAGFISDNADLLGSNPQLSVGSWYDPGSNKTYLELSVAVEDRGVAEQLAREFNQKSIINLENFEVIDTGGTGEVPVGLSTEETLRRLGIGFAASIAALLADRREEPIPGVGLLAATIAGASFGGVGKHGLVPMFLVRSRAKQPAAGAKLLGKTNVSNAAKQVDALDQIFAKHINPTRSNEAWIRMAVDALGSDIVPVPPYRAIKLINNPGMAADEVRRASREIYESAREGLSISRDLGDAYRSGAVQPRTTAKLILWSFLSRRARPAEHEARFLDAARGIDRFVDAALEGRWTKKIEREYARWAEKSSPKGSLGEGATVINLLHFGRQFLRNAAEKGPDGLTHLRWLHDAISSDMTAKEIRREWHKRVSGAGIDNKILSFTLLVSGRPDVLVYDRWRVRHDFDDGRFAAFNIYDGGEETGKGLAPLFNGVRGLMYYEALEDGYRRILPQVFDNPEDRTLGMFHWITWSNMAGPASHSSLRGILAEALGRPDPYSNIFVTEQVATRFAPRGAGRRGLNWAAGARYGWVGDRPVVRFATSDGTLYEFDPPGFRQFIREVKKPKNGIVPRNLRSQHGQERPWYEQPGVDRAKLDELIRIRGTPVQEAGVGRVADVAGQTAAGLARRVLPSAGHRATERGGGLASVAVPAALAAGAMLDEDQQNEILTATLPLFAMRRGGGGRFLPDTETYRLVEFSPGSIGGRESETLLDRFVFETPAGDIEVRAGYRPETKSIYVQWLGRAYDPESVFPPSRERLPVGRTGIKHIMAQVIKRYPEAETISAQRISGARVHGALKSVADLRTEIPIPEEMRSVALPAAIAGSAALASDDSDKGAAATTAAAMATPFMGRPRFFSRLTRALETGPEKTTGKKWLDRVIQFGPRAEREATGIEEFLRANLNRSLTREEVLANYRPLQIKELVKSYEALNNANERLRVLLDEADEVRRERDALVDELGSQLGYPTTRLVNDRLVNDARTNARFWAFVDSFNPDLDPWGLDISDMSPQALWDYARETTQIKPPATPDKLYETTRALRDKIAQSRRLENEIHETYALLDSSTPQYQNYIIPAYENADPSELRYREVLLAMPNTTGDPYIPYISPHFRNVPNLVVHLRLTDRRVGNEKTLFIEEIQSDWAQSARISQEGIPKPPIGDTNDWLGLAMKRAIDEAVEKGYGRVAWTSGEQQAQRYDLGARVQEIVWERVLDQDGKEAVAIFVRRPGDSDTIPPDFIATIPLQGRGYEERFGRPVNLDELIGSELANAIRSSKESHGTFKGSDLRVGGHGMAAFYDRMVPEWVRNFAKKQGVKIEIEDLPLQDRGRLPVDDPGPVHSFRITPELREMVERGIPLLGLAAMASDDEEAAAGPGSGPLLTAASLPFIGRRRFFSRLTRAIETGPEKTTGKKWLDRITQLGHKAEREATGIETFLLANLNKSLTRSEVLANYQPLVIREITKSYSKERRAREKLGAALYRQISEAYDRRKQLLSRLEYALQTEYESVVEEWLRRYSPDMSRAEIIDLTRSLTRREPIDPDLIRPIADDYLSASREFDRLRRLERSLARRVDRSTPLYARWRLPGPGTHYREVLLTLPKLGVQYKGPHFPEKNIVAHLRLSDRMADGERILFVEEIQSDWAQSLRKDLDDLPPEMPFSETGDWLGLAMKRIIDEAVEKGYDRVAWTTGAQQGDRFDLSARVEEINWRLNRIDDHRVTIIAREPGGGVTAIRAPVYGRSLDSEGRVISLEDALGKDMAEKIRDSIGRKIDHGSFSGPDLRVGGHGLSAFYDQIIPDWVRNYAKKQGIQLEIKQIPLDPDDPSSMVHSFAVTPELREMAERGLPLLGVAGMITSEDEEREQGEAVRASVLGALFMRKRAGAATGDILQKVSFAGGKAPRDPNALKRLYIALADELARMTDVSEFRKGLLEGAGKLDVSRDVELLARTSQGWAGYANAILENGVTKPGSLDRRTRGLNRIYEEVGGRADDLTRYRLAVSALEQHAQGKQTPFDEWIENGELERIVDELGKDKDIVRWHEELKDYHYTWMRLLEEEGVLRTLRKEEIDEGFTSVADVIRSKRAEYVPFFRAEPAGPEAAETLKKPRPTTGGMRRLIRLPEAVKRMSRKGSDLPIIDPMESDVRMTFAYANIVARNRVQRSLALLADEVPDNAFVERVDGRETIRGVLFDKSQLKGYIDEEILDEIDGDLLQIFTKRTLREMPKEIFAVNGPDGKKLFYRVKDPLLLTALMGLDPAQLPAAVRVLSLPAMALRAGVTLTPDFQMANWLRDTLQVAATSRYTGPALVSLARAAMDAVQGLAVMMAGSIESPGKRAMVGALHGGLMGTFAATGPAEESDEERRRRRLLGGLAGAAVGASFGLGARAIAGTEKRFGMKAKELVDLWRTSGADQAAYVSMDRQHIAEAVRRMSRKGRKIPVAWTPSDAIHALRSLGEAYENANRIAEFSRVLQAEGGALRPDAVLRAGYASRDVSIDFRRHGSLTRWLRPLAAFWNARLQGFDKLRRVAQENPKRVVGTMLVGVTLPSLALYAVNRDNPDYWRVPMWERNLFWLVPLPDGGFLRIPKPFELGLIFGSFVERFIEDIDPNNPHRGGLVDVGNTAWGSFWRSFVEMLLPLPTVATPLIENAIEYDFFRQRDQYSPFEPPTMDANMRGRDVSSLTAGRISDVAFGASAKVKEFSQQHPRIPVIRSLASWLEVTPVEIDNVLADWTGSIGRMAVEEIDRQMRTPGIGSPLSPPLPNLTEQIGQPPLRRREDQPFAGRFFSDVPENYSESVARFYELKRQIEGAAATQRKIMTPQFIERAEEFLRRRGIELSLADYINEQAEELQALRDAIETIELDPSLPPAEKRIMIDEARRQMDTLAEAALEVVRAASGEFPPEPVSTPQLLSRTKSLFTGERR